MTARFRVNRNISVPAYQQVANHLKSLITEGKISAGGRLPAESELIEDLKLSRVTVRKGLEVLEDEGIVERKQGLGTFVRRPFSQELSNTQTITEVLMASGITPSVKVLSFKAVRPPVDVYRALGIEQGEKVLLAKRLYLNEGDPVALLNIFLPLKFKKAAEPLRHESTETTFTIWERAGIPISGATHSIRAARADYEDARELGIKRGSPVLVLDRVTFGLSGEPLEFIMYHYHWQRYAFSVSAPRINPKEN